MFHGFQKVNGLDPLLQGAPEVDMSSWGPSQDLRESFSGSADSDSDARVA